MLFVFSILTTPHNVNAKFPLAFKTNKQVYCFSMYKHTIIKTIVVIWFLLCIVPGDCLLLDCAGENASACHEKASAILSCGNADTCFPQTDAHCPNCCTLCANHLVLPLFQNFSFVFTSPASLVKMPLFTHFDGIFQTLIYHPPRLTA